MEIITFIRHFWSRMMQLLTEWHIKRTRGIWTGSRLLDESDTFLLESPTVSIVFFSFLEFFSGAIHAVDIELTDSWLFYNFSLDLTWLYFVIFWENPNRSEWIVFLLFIGYGHISPKTDGNTVFLTVLLQHSHSLTFIYRSGKNIDNILCDRRHSLDVALFV